MPTYVYKGLKTGKIFELEQRITEAALTKNPKTGEPVERVIQAAGIVFKGGGFYKTDSRPAEKSGGKSGSSQSDSGDAAKPVGETAVSRDAGKASGSKASDSKSGDSKSSDSKSGDSKSGDSKPSKSGGEPKASKSKD
jgi:predicted nucleic acid-binding Zn ribbon protein